MKRIFILLLITGLFWGCSEDTSRTSADGKTSFHGATITETDAVPITKLGAMMAGKTELTGIKVSGDIIDVCAKKGCWMNVKTAANEQMMVRFKDYKFFVPKDCGGKQAIMEGKAFMDTVSVEMLVHYAMDGGMSEEEAIAKYTEPKPQMAFEATGVIIKNNN